MRPIASDVEKHGIPIKCCSLLKCNENSDALQKSCEKCPVK
jgi:hypothetical protein